MEPYIRYFLFVLEAIYNAFTDGLTAIIDLFERKRGFNAEFGKESDIASVFNKGFVISKRRKLTRKASFQNVMVSGPTGAGKTVRYIIKSLFELKNCSIVLTDPSKELYNLCSGYLSQYFNIISLSFADSSISAGYNFLSRIKKQNDINKLVNVVVSATLDKGTNNDPYWSLSTKSLLNTLTRLILHQPIEYRNMANLLHVLNTFSYNAKVVDKWIVETKDENLITQYKSLISTPEKTLQNIVSSAKASLSCFEDPEIIKTTSYDSFDLDNIRKEPTIIFINSGIADQKYLSMLQGLFFEQLFSHFLERVPEKKELDVFMILEECSSIYIPLLPLALANLRKHRVGSMLCLQQGNTQLRKLYGDDDALNISSNCLTKIMLPGITEMQTLQQIETLSGKTTYKDDKGVEKVKSLVTADEARLLGDNRSLILHANKPIIKGYSSPFYKSYRYRKYSEILPVPMVSDIPDTPIILMK